MERACRWLPPPSSPPAPLPLLPPPSAAAAAASRIRLMGGGRGGGGEGEGRGGGGGGGGIHRGSAITHTNARQASARTRSVAMSKILFPALTGAGAGGRTDGESGRSSRAAGPLPTARDAANSPRCRGEKKERLWFTSAPRLERIIRGCARLMRVESGLTGETFEENTCGGGEA